MHKKFNPDNLKQFLQESAYWAKRRNGDLRQAIKNHLDIPFEKIERIANGKEEPTLDELMQLSWFFSVPLDFLAGICNLDTAKQILRHPVWAMEAGLINRNNQFFSQARVTAINRATSDRVLNWPENLMVAVNYDEPIDFLPTEDHIRGIEAALDTVLPREKMIILKYYREGKTHVSIGNELGITRNRVHDIMVHDFPAA